MKNIEFFLVIYLLSCGGGNVTPKIKDQSFHEVFEIKELMQEEPSPDVGEDNDVTGENTQTCKEGYPCDDGDKCTYGETCKGGECTGGVTYECNDNRGCTEDMCDGNGGCEFVIKENSCLISGICYSTHDIPLENPCVECNPLISKTSFTSLPDGKECMPIDLPNCKDAFLGHCKQGKCEPDVLFEKDCNDNNPCTVDVCDEGKGCIHEPITGGKCIGKNKCDVGECNEGKCVVYQGKACDDGNLCTNDICDPEKGCIHEALTGPICDDQDACTIEDRCEEGVCKGIPLNCDDGNICTSDGCDKSIGCFHDIAVNPCCEGGVAICDDSNPCTNDECDPVTFECKPVFNNSACDDSDPCTVADMCNQGICKGQAKNCDDGNPCTADECQNGQCISKPLSGIPCDDQIACSKGDHCEAGKCVADMSECGCKPVFYATVNKVTSLTIPASGHPGDGLDLDENPATCAPEGDCSGGIDNSLGPVGSLGNDPIKKDMEAGKIIMLLEHRDLKTDGKPYVLALYGGKVDPENAQCNVQKETCSYLVDKATIDKDCKPVVTFDNAKIVGNKFTAGGKKYTFPFELPLMGGVTLHVDLYYAKIEATVTVSGGKITSMTGILGGAVPKEQIKQGILKVPPEQLPIPPDQIIGLLDILVKEDIDGNGDGKKESASICLKFTAIPGKISGVD